LPVVFLQALDAFGCGFQTPQQRGVGGALPIGNLPGWRGWALSDSESFDLGAQLGLAVEPGPGDRASLARASKVIGMPVASIRRKAEVARLRVTAARCRAAAMMWWELSARISGVFLLVLLDLTDHAVQVGEDLFVHLDHTSVAFVLEDVAEGERVVALFTQLGQELRGR
jgi:hypothetical protein